MCVRSSMLDGMDATREHGDANIHTHLITRLYDS